MDKYLEGRASGEEEQQLIGFFDGFKPEEEWNTKEMGVRKALEEKMLRRLMQSIQEKRLNADEPAIRATFSRRNIATAVTIIIVTCVVYFTLRH